jgi:hypothetical protein
LNATILQEMETNYQLEQGINAVKQIADNPSWFRSDPHRWMQSSLPLAYAVACVEVISKKSEKSGQIYRQLVEAWVFLASKEYPKRLSPKFLIQKWKKLRMLWFIQRRY